MKININDFSLFAERSKLNATNFCSSCDTPVTSSDCDEDGYTDCCNEPTIDRNQFILSSKFISISKFLENLPFVQRPAFIFEVREFPFGHKVVIPDSNLEFSISLKSDPNIIIDQINLQLQRI